MTHTPPERLRCEVCDMPTLGDTLCNQHYEEQEKMTHTPGPWFQGQIKGAEHQIFTSDSGVFIDDDEANPADIAFIVRACNSHEAMLEVLKDAAHDGRLQTFEDRERFRKAAKEAIRLAEGRG